MATDVVIKNPRYKGSYSRMVTAMQQVAGKIDTTTDGLYDQKVVLKTGDVKISNEDLDLEFEIPFDDDTEANEAEIVVYNLTDATISAMEKGAAISITAGYGSDTGVIFAGFISKKKTYWENNDKVTVLYAIDDNGKQETEVTELSFGAGTKASTILRRLVERLGLPLAVFEIRRDHTYKDKVTVDGGLMENIKKYAQICGVVAYICKSKTYVCPLTYGKHETFNLTADTGLLSYSEYEEEVTAEEYKDHVTGVDIEMLLQHQIQTGSIINLSARNVKGDFRVSEGSHTYDGETFKTTVKAVSYDCITK